MKELQLPTHYDADKYVPTGSELFLSYEDLAHQARDWASSQSIPPVSQDTVKVCLMAIDMQLTFCHPQAELPVIGAVEDGRRLAEFIYRNLGNITGITPTLDTHLVMQIFHEIFLVDDQGNHPQPGTPESMITEDQIKTGKWHVNPAVATAIAKGNLPALENHLAYYTSALKGTGKESLIVWPYHALLGSVGHALMPIVEEALRFHQFSRSSADDPQIKGGHPLTENYSVIQPNVTEHIDGANKNPAFLEKLLAYDMLIIAGEAKSHCVADSIEDILTHIMAKDRSLAEKVYLLEDCTSPVVIVPGDQYLDFTAKGESAFQKFADAGMHIVQSTTPMWEWPDSPVLQP